jgi:hypothetical protein
VVVLDAEPLFLPEDVPLPPPLPRRLLLLLLLLLLLVLGPVRVLV